MLWSKQYYRIDVEPLARRRPGRPAAAARAPEMGATPAWRHFDAADILSMPDKWEYPWFAAWDLAFHAVTLAHVDPAFAKYQLLAHCAGSGSGTPTAQLPPTNGRSTTSTRRSTPSAPWRCGEIEGKRGHASSSSGSSTSCCSTSRGG